MMYADQLAWHLKDTPDEQFRLLPVDTLKDMQRVLQHHDPMLNSDLAAMAIARCNRLVGAALKTLGY